MARRDDPPEVAALFPKMKPHVTVTMYLWGLLPVYVAVLVIGVAYLTILNGQAERITKRDRQFCDIGRLFVLIEPILPRILQEQIDAYVDDLQKNGTVCDPAIVKPQLSPSPTPSADSRPMPHRHHGPKPHPTMTVPGPTSYVTITKTPAGVRPSRSAGNGPPKKHHHKKTHHPKPRSKLCTIERALAGKCVLDFPTPNIPIPGLSPQPRGDD